MIKQAFWLRFNTNVIDKKKLGLHNILPLPKHEGLKVSRMENEAHRLKALSPKSL